MPFSEIITDPIYTVTLSDGTSFAMLKLNGNNFVSSTPIFTDQFIGKLQQVEISDGTTTQIFQNLQLIQIMEYNEEWYFILAPIPREDMLEAYVDYIAMMSGIEDDQNEIMTLSGDRSQHYDKVSNYYRKGTWQLPRVHKAVEKGWITESEYTEITGLNYL